MAGHGRLEAILTPEQAGAAIAASRDGVRVVYKHSPVCDRSAAALDEVGAFLEGAGAGMPVHIVDVLSARPASQWIEAVTGVRHESPQALVFADERVVWHASHRAVTARALTEAVHAARQARTARGSNAD